MPRNPLRDFLTEFTPAILDPEPAAAYSFVAKVTCRLSMLASHLPSIQLQRPVAVKEVIRAQGLQEEALLKDAPDATCKV